MHRWWMLLRGDGNEPEESDPGAEILPEWDDTRWADQPTNIRRTL